MFSNIQIYPMLKKKHLPRTHIASDLGKNAVMLVQPRTSHKSELGQKVSSSSSLSRRGHSFAVVRIVSRICLLKICTHFSSYILQLYVLFKEKERGFTQYCQYITMKKSKCLSSPLPLECLASLDQSIFTAEAIFCCALAQQPRRQSCFNTTGISVVSKLVDI